MTWTTAHTYSAKIGEIIYRNVRCPISITGESAIRLSRHTESGQLAATFDLRREDGTNVASVSNNTITGFDATVFHLLQAYNRSALVELGTRRVWYELTCPQVPTDYELDVSCILFAGPGYPVLLHPDRSKFGAANNNQPPSIARLTLRTDPGGKSTAIALNAAPFYLLGIAIENFDVGVKIDLEVRSGASRS